MSSLSSLISSPVFRILLLISLAGAVSCESTDAAKSIAVGTGLQYATSGVLAQFTVTAKDESGVRRTSGGDEFIVELEGTRSISGSVIDNLDGTYPVSYTPTKSGNYEASVKLAKSGGLAGSYFENVWFFYTPVKTTVNPTINLDWGVGPITETGMDYVSVRWQGKVKPQFYETHTFFISSDDGAKLWVDNVLLIDRWDSMNNDTSATIALRPHVFYNIRLDYKEVTGSAFIRLSWQSQSTPKEIIPAYSLYYETHVKQSPFSLFVSPSVADGSRSTAAGEGLGLATAGTAAQLTLQANDMYDNERGEGEDIFSVRVFPPNTIEAGATGRPVHAVVVDESDSSYTAEYTTYKSGASTLYATLLVAGGVQATYYDSNEFTDPVKYAEKTTALQNVQFKSTVASDNDYSIATVDGFSVRYVGHVAPPSDTTFTFTWDRPDGDGSSSSWLIVSAGASTTSFTLAASSSQAVGAYVGMCIVVDDDGNTAGTGDQETVTITSNTGSGVVTVSPALSFTPAGTTSAYYIMPCGEDRVRLWVDNALIIDQWSSLATGDPSGTIDLRANYFYDVRVDYKMVSGCTSGECLLPSAQLKWSYGAVPSTELTSTDLFRGYDVMDMPTSVDVNPAGTSASKSFATPNQAAAGHSLELATAGLQAEFTITAKDLYGNLRLVGEEKFKVRLSGVDSLAGVVEDLAPDSPGAYRVLYTATKSGTYDVSVVFGASGISQSPFRLIVQPSRRHLINSPATGQALTLSTAGVTSSVTITIRDRHDNWQPDPVVALAGVAFTASHPDDFDDKVPVNQDTLQTADKPFYFDTVSYIGDPSLAGTQVATPTNLDNPRLILRYTITKSGRYSLKIGGDAVHEEAVMDSPFDLTIHPSPACAVTSTATGSYLSLATGGAPGTFTVQARDMYYNQRGEHVGDNFVARVRQYYGKGPDNRECFVDGVECESWETYNFDWVTVGGRDKQGTVVDQGDGTYEVSYTATRGGLNYVWTSLAVAGGLHATYYMSSTPSDIYSDSTIFGKEAQDRVVQEDSNIDFSVTSSAPVPLATQTTWAARWTGLVLPSRSEVYTFYLGGDTASTQQEERVKLWVDNSIVIQQWTSLATNTAPSGRIALEANNYYEILAAAKTSTADDVNTAKMQLSWKSFSHAETVISTSRLFFSYHVSNSPFQVEVAQSSTCSSSTRVFKTGLSIATAGIMASFTIQGRDSFNNIRPVDFDDGRRDFDWAIMANATLPDSPEEGENSQDSELDGGSVAYETTLVHTGGGGVQVNYTVTKANVYGIRGRLLNAGGLFGTYFENEDLTDHGTSPDGSLSFVPPLQRLDETIDFEWMGARPVGSVTLGTGTLLDSGIVYSGDTSSPYNQVTLDLTTASPIPGAYVNSRLLINGEERAITASSPPANAGTIASGSSNATISLDASSSPSTVDDFYVGWTVNVYESGSTTFESALVSDYTVNVTSSSYVLTLDTALANGDPSGKAYFLDGARVVTVGATFLLPIEQGTAYSVVDITESKDIGPDYFSVRWLGMIKPEYSEVFTFSVFCDDGARLYVNDLLILDHWYSRISEVDGTIAVMAGTLYPLRLEYKQVTGNATVQLRWSSRSQTKSIVPSTALYTRVTTHRLSNSDDPLFVEPAVACASTSSADGPGLTIATAGVMASFSIQSRDAYMNNRKVADAGIRPGYAGYGNLINWGTLTFSSASEVTLASTAATTEHAYKGFKISIDSTGEQRTITAYNARVATVDPPFSSVPTSLSAAYKVIDLISPDATALMGYNVGYPEWHARVLPVADGSETIIHSIPYRLSSAQFAGGLTATYYDHVATNDALDGDRSWAADTLGTPRWSTWCTAGQPCDYTIDFSESANFKKKLYGDGCGVIWTGLTHSGVTRDGTSPYLARLEVGTASGEANAYVGHYILFTDGTCRGRYAQITVYPNSTKDALLEAGTGLWADGGLACMHGTGDAYEIYFNAELPVACFGDNDLTRGWRVTEPREDPDASLANNQYAVRWAGFISPTVSGTYTFYAELPTADADAATDDRVKLWIDNQVVIMSWTSLAGVNGARSGTFDFIDSYPSMHSISVHYKNSADSHSGLKLRWQSAQSGHTHSFSTAYSGQVPTNVSACNSGQFSSEYCRLDSMASATVDGLYNMQYIKFTSPGACNGRWTRISADNASSAAEGYASGSQCIKMNSATWLDGDAGCTCAQGDQYKLVEWLGLDGMVTAQTSTCQNQGHLVTGTLTSSASLVDTSVSISPSDVTSMSLIIGSYIKINDEIMLITNITGGGTLGVTRAAAGSTGGAHSTGSIVYALSQFNMAMVEVPKPGSTFENMIILFTTGNCKGRYGSVTTFDSSTFCATIGGTTAAYGGNNWLDGGQGCTVSQGDSYVIKFGIDSTGVTTSSGAAGALTTANWLKMNGALRPDSDDCALSQTTVRLGARASVRTDDYTSLYVKFTSGTCAGEWAEVTGYHGPHQCATLRWESLGKGSSTGQQTAVSMGGGNLNISALDTIVVVDANVQTLLNIRAGSYIEIDDEVLLVKHVISSTQLMVERGQSNTAPAPHADNATISVVGIQCSEGDSYTLGVTAGGTIVPSTRLFPLAGRYQAEFTPTVRGDYQVQASLAQGSGLDATFYDDQELTEVVSSRVYDNVNFNVEDDQVGFKGDLPRSLESELSDRLSFSVRWGGLLQLDDHITDDTPQTFTFEASIAETDERVKLWVDHSLIIDRWDTYDHLSSTTFSATIALSRPNYYDLKMEYKQYAGSHAQAVLKWHCAIAGSACETKSVIPSSNLFRVQEIRDSPFPPFEVMPAPTCSAASTADGIGLSSATAGEPASITIQAMDEYMNDRGGGGDIFVVRAVPFNTFDAMEPHTSPRTSKDCIACPQTLYGNVSDMADASYEATFIGTKKGAYKLLPSLALGGGLFATYYAGVSGGGSTSFHRAHQIADSQTDFVSACVLRNAKVGVPLTTYECSSPGYDFSDTAVELSSTFAGGSTTTALDLGTAASPDDDAYVGMQITITSGPAAYSTREITAYAGATNIATVSPALPEAPTGDYKIVGSKFHRNAGWISGAGSSFGTTTTTTVTLPASASWTVHDSEPYSSWIAKAADGTGALRTNATAAADGGSGCMNTVSGARLALEASGTDGAYANKYIRFTSGDCNGRWTKITGYEGPSYSGTTVWGSDTILTLGHDAVNTSGFYLSATVCVTSGAITGECRAITAWDGNNLTVGSAFSQAVNNMETITIHGNSKCATLETPWADDGATSCAPNMGDTYKLTGGWTLVITGGTCAGQYKTIANYEPNAAGGGVATLESAWDTSDQTAGAGPYGETSSWSYTGCTKPDSTSTFVLIPQSKAPGSIDSIDNTFGVRWAGFVMPSTQLQYTFTAEIPDAASAQERVKLWVDNTLLIDQWSSLSATSPSGTLAFTDSPSNLYHVQLEYKRAATSSKPPKVQLTWLNTLAGSEANPAQTLQAYRLYTDLPVPNDDQVIDLLPAGTDPKASTASGKGLTAATAGSEASFTIVSRDEYANLRELDEDSYIVHVQGPTFSESPQPHASFSSPGRYHVSHLPTESGDYAISVHRAMAGGLKSEWFNNMWLMGDPADEYVDVEVDYDWGTGFVSPNPGETKTGSDYVSVRWSGYFKPEISETYTFIVEYDDGARLTIDGEKLVDDWEGTMGPEAHATFAATSEKMHSLVLEYREVKDTASVKLSYRSASVLQSVVPSSRLYHSPESVFGSPYRLYVNPTVTCAATSTIDGAGLSSATAGLRNMFTIQAFDEYSNAKTKWEDTFIVRASHHDGSMLAEHGTVSAHVTKGKYSVQYQTTKAGPLTVFSSLAVSGGVYATYYDGVSSTYYNIPMKAEAVETIAPSTYDGAPAYTVRWAGLFRPSNLDVHTFTPLASATYDNNDRIKLWLDTKLIIDQWSSLDVAIPTGTIAFAVSDEYYEIEMLYQVSSWGGPQFTGTVQAGLPTTCPETMHQFRLGTESAEAGSVANAPNYANMFVQFTSGNCNGKWSAISTYTNPADDTSATTTSSANATTATTITLDPAASSENGYYVGATVLIDCADASLNTMTRTITAYDGTSKIATVDSALDTTCVGSSLPLAGNATYLISNYQIKCTNLGSGTWDDGVTSGCKPLAGDAYKLYYGHNADMQITTATGGGPASIVSDRLSKIEHLAGSPFTVNVETGPTDFTQSEIYGPALTLATAGVSATFTITVKDAYGNDRTVGGDEFVVQLTDVGSGSLLTAQVTDLLDGMYEADYTPTIQGSYDLYVYHGTSVKTSTVYVEPGVICASASYSNGLSLTLGTAGFTATFTIQSKDAYKNLRTDSADQFVIRLIGPDTEEHNVRPVYIGQSPNTNLGRYTVAYRTTLSGSFAVSVRAATTAGLNGTYYRDTSLGQAAYSEISDRLTHDWGSESPSEDLGITDSFSVEWKGFVKPLYSQEYTFTTKVAENDERVKLWVDDHWVVDQWSSLLSTQPSGTIWLANNQLYDITAQYKETFGNAKIELHWKSSSQATQVIPSTSLFTAAEHVQGSPFAATMYPARTSGTVSTAQGAGLSLTTAGEQAYFTISARDHLGNLKTTTDDTFVVRARHNGDFTRSNRIGTVVSIAPGLYSATYIATWKRNHLSDDGWNIDPVTGSTVGLYGDPGSSGIRKKFHDVVVSQGILGGLMATYYSGIPASFGGGTWSDQLGQEPWVAPYRTKLVPTVDQAGSGSAAAVTTNMCVDSADTFGVRYAGFFSPPTAQRYSFRATVTSNTDERVRLWIDNSLVIDQWSSLAATACGAGCYEGTVQFGTADVLHDLYLEYKDAGTSNTDSKVELSYVFPTQTLAACVETVGSGACSSCTNLECTYDGSAAVIPSSRLWQSHDLGFKIWEAGGLTATYYDNHLGVYEPALDGGIVQVDPVGVASSAYTNMSACTVGCLTTGCPGSGLACTCYTDINGTVTSVQVTAEGQDYIPRDPPLIECAGGAGQSFFPRFAYAGGVVGGPSGTNAVTEPTVDWSGASYTDRPYRDSVVNGQFSVRWSGFIQPSRADEYTFYVPLAGGADTMERVRLWLDNSLIIDQWASMDVTAPAVEPSGTARFPVPNEYYDIQLDYKITSATQDARGFSLQWENRADRLPGLYGMANADENDRVEKGIVRSDRLFQARVTSDIVRDDRDLWDTDFYDPAQGWVLEDRSGTGTSGQWAKTNGCPSASGTLRYEECRGLGTRANEVLRVDVKPAVLCATTSTVKGAALSISTAGVTRTFTLTARDAYDNQRDATDDSFIARAVLADNSDYKPFHGTFEHQDWELLLSDGETNPMWDQNGKYEITYVITRSAEFQHTVKEADTAGTGLFGAYFVGKELDTGGLLGTQQDAQIDFNWDPEYGPVSSDVALGEDGCWSARWTGYVEPVYSEVYTFSVYSDGGVRVWVDQTMIIDQWASTTETEHHGTVLLVGSVLYDIQVDYLPGKYEKKLQLSWSSVSQTKETIPSSALRTAANLLLGGSNRLYVLPTVVCASTSDIAGPGLSIATAGITASFTVWSKDMYGNLRDDALDFFQARMVPDDAATESGVVYAGTGLQATYYDYLGFAMPTRAATSGSYIAFTDTSDLDQTHFNDGSSAVSLASNGFWSARWAGLVRPTSTEEYTFHLTMTANTEERVRLWIDNSMLIDQWTSLLVAAPSGTISATGGMLYRVKVDYKNPNAATSSATLAWQSATATGGAQETVTSKFLYPCKYTSSLNSLGSACDVDAKIQTQTTDNTGADNMAHGDTESGFGAYRLSPSVYDGSSTTFANFQGNQHPFSYIQTRAGSHTIYSAEVTYDEYPETAVTFAAATGTGLMATYYETANFGTPRNAYDCQRGRIEPCLTGTAAFSTSGLSAPFSLTPDGTFSVRYAGMVRAPVISSPAGLTTFTGGTGSTTSADERVKLWVDNSLVIDQWTSLASTSPETPGLRLTANQLYDVKVEYKNVLAGTADGAAFNLQWTWWDGAAQTSAVVPSAELFASHLVTAAPRRVRVNPAVAYAPSCEVHGKGLTLATSGVQASFLIHSKDAYNNVRGVGGDLFVVRAFSDGCQTLSVGRDFLCDGFSGTTTPDGTAATDLNSPCSDAATCAPYPPQVASNGPNLYGDLVPGGDYINEITGLSVAADTRMVVPFPNASNTVLSLRPSELDIDDIYVGASITLAGGCAAAGSQTIVDYVVTDTWNEVIVESAFGAAVTSDCTYVIAPSPTALHLSSAASEVSGAYDNYYIRFTSGTCNERWTKVKSYKGGMLGQVKAMALEADVAPWMAGTVSAQADATNVTLGSPADTSTTQVYQGMYITVKDSLGASMGTRKIKDYQNGHAILEPALSAASGASTFTIHGWTDGGMACAAAASDTFTLIPKLCETVIDEGTLSDPTYSVTAIEVTTAGSSYTAGAFTVTCTGACTGSGLAGYCIDDIGGGNIAVGADSIVITNAGSGYDPSNPPTIDCAGGGSSLVVSLTMGVTGFTLAASASVTDSAYVGYTVSVDTSGERRSVSAYSTSRVVTVSQAFTDAPTSNVNQYTVRGCPNNAGPLYCPQCPRIVRADVVDMGDSTYKATFTGTRKGQYTVVTSLVAAGGLMSTYYDDEAAFSAVNDFAAGTPQASRVDATVDWSQAALTSTPSATLSDAQYGVRWVGFVRPSRANEYTFHMTMPNAGEVSTLDERVKLWVDNSIVIQQWTSLASTAPSGTIGFGKGNGYYDISAVYKCSGQVSGGCGMNLLWESTASGVASEDTAYGRIPSDRLFQRYDVPNSASGLAMQPSVTCGSESTVLGQGLTLATAGVWSSFTIQAKDAYENTREDTSSAFSLSLHGSGGTPVSSGAITEDPPSTAATYTASFNLQNAKGYQVFLKYGNDNLKGSPFSLTVKPAGLCGTTSTIRGTGLTASSISPTKSAFTIQARDEYGNAKTQGIAGPSQFVVRVARTADANQQGTNGLPPMYGSTVGAVSGTLHGVFNTATNDGRFAGYYQVPATPDPGSLTHYLYASLAATGGITATYYTTSDGGSTLSTPVDQLNDGTDATKHLAIIGTNGGTVTTSNAAPTPSTAVWGGQLTGSDDDFVVRWSGLYLNVNQTAKYFKWDSSVDTDRVKIWVDNRLIIDQWSSLAATNHTAAYTFDAVDALYDVQVEWMRQTGSASAAVDLQDSSDNAVFSDITSDRLYYIEDISGSPYAVTVSS